MRWNWESTFFDHADIYGGGSCEEIFAKAVDMKPSVREKMILQSKCSIRDGYYDASAAYIRKAVDDILARLHTDYLDILLLHRPDALMDPGETAEALERCTSRGRSVISAFPIIMSCRQSCCRNI